MIRDLQKAKRIRRFFFGQIDAHHAAGKPAELFFGRVFAAVKADRREAKACGRDDPVILRKTCREIRVRAQAGVKRERVGTGRISDSKDVLGAKAILVRIGKQPADHAVQILDRRRKSVVRSQPVGVIDHGKPAPGKIHAVELVRLLGTVDPAAAVNADDDGNPWPGSFRAVQVQNLPYRVGAVGNIVKPLHIIRRGKPGIPLIVAFPAAAAKLPGNDHAGRLAYPVGKNSHIRNSPYYILLHSIFVSHETFTLISPHAGGPPWRRGAFWSRPLPRNASSWYSRPCGQARLQRGKCRRFPCTARCRRCCAAYAG